MKDKAIKKSIFQGFIFNIIILLGVLIGLFSYFLPEFLAIEVKKSTFVTLQDNLKTLKNQGLSYEDFNKIYKSDKKNQDLEIDSLLKNFKKNDYNGNFFKSEVEFEKTKENYKISIDKLSKDVKIKKEKLDESGVSGKIKKILPYYIDDSKLDDITLDEEYLTDFEFINYMENLINNFDLSYKNNLGIGNLSLEESLLNKEESENDAEGKIYNFKLDLKLEGKKRNLIDLIYYFENVGNIYIEEVIEDKNSNINVKKLNTNSTYTNEDGIEVKNNFGRIGRYFDNNKDIFNNLVVDIDKITLKEYIDSSDLPTLYEDGESFINFIRMNQGNEKYNIDLTLKFYVKGLPLLKTKKYIKSVYSKYNLLKKDISININNLEKIKSTLNYTELDYLKKLRSYNQYLGFISEDIKSLINSKEKIGNTYYKAQSYNKIFDKILSSLIIEEEEEDKEDEEVNKSGQTQRSAPTENM